MPGRRGPTGIVPGVQRSLAGGRTEAVRGFPGRAGAGCATGRGPGEYTAGAAGATLAAAATVSRPDAALPSDGLAIRFPFMRSLPLPTLTAGAFCPFPSRAR